MDTVGERIKYIRENANLNQKDFCTRINLSQGRLSEIENNKTKPSFETLESIKSNFNISLDWLVTGVNDGISVLEYPKVSVKSIETDIIAKFKKLPLHDQEEIYYIVNMKYDRRPKNSGDVSYPSQNGNERTGDEEAAAEEVTYYVSGTA